MILLIIIITYALMIGYFYLGINKLSITSEIIKPEDLSKPFTKFSIIIPFRNEAEKLPSLLNSIKDIDYPKDCFEVLLIDDESSDNSVLIIEEFTKQLPLINFSLLNNHRVSASPKKDAITTAISKAKNEWIITTDADCLLPPLWLSSYHNYILNNQKEFIAAPVIYKASNAFIDQYQLLDNLSLQGVTLGGFARKKGLLCNGANLAYTKSLFKALNGFKNNKHIASGDDIFMLENTLIKFPEKVGYLKSPLAIVTTFPEKKWQDLISQRVRWAKKTGNQKNAFVKIIGLLVFAANISILFLPFLLILFGLNIWIGIIALFIKILIDYLLLHKTGQFFGKHISVVQVIIHVYIYALVSCWVVIKSMFTNYTWKQRTHSQ